MKDATSPVTENALSLNILKVVKDETITPKVDHPTVDKKIGTDISTGVSSNTATIGDKIPYVIASKVPEMVGYNKYFFVLNDTMSKGLTFNNDVVIKIGTTTLDTTAYDVTYDTATNSMKIVIKDFISYKAQAGQDIVVTYSATLNENADTTQTGNVNTVGLTYSNNPNVDSQGDTDNGKPDEPAPTDPTGKTPDVKTVTYATKLQLTKVDGSDHDLKLEGVKFQLIGTSMQNVLVNGTYFKQDAAGTYYQLKDGTFTETAPTAPALPLPLMVEGATITTVSALRTGVILFLKMTTSVLSEPLAATDLIFQTLSTFASELATEYSNGVPA